MIAATNRDLVKEVERGTFRRDLYFRLNVVNFRLAPLRERKEDIPALINHFLARIEGNYSLTSETLEAILSYEWPGNIRELENCLQHMVAINTGPLLHLTDLPSALQNSLAQRKVYSMAAAIGGGITEFPIAEDLKPTPKPVQSSTQITGGPSTSVIPLLELERRAIMGALEYTNGDRAVAAHLLGIGRTTLYRKLKEYELAS